MNALKPIPVKHHQEPSIFNPENLQLGDFEKSEANGSTMALRLIYETVKCLGR